MKTIKIGLIGCGAISSVHINAIKEIPKTVISAVADPNPEKAKNAAQKAGCEYFTDYRDMVNKKDIDIVHILTPSGLRKDIAIYCASKGKNILTEKPLEVTCERIDEIIEACRKNEVFLTSIFNRRYNETYIYVKRLIDEGRLGRLILSDVIMKWYREPSYYENAPWRGTYALDGGGALMNQCIHFIDLIRWFTGECKSVFCYTEKALHKNIEAEDTATGVLKFKNSALGMIQASTALYPGYTSRISIHGTCGGIIIENDQIIDLKLGSMTQDDLVMLKKVDLDRSKSAATNIKSDYDLHKKQIEEYVKCVRETIIPSIDGIQARYAVEIIEAMYKSAAENRPVEI